MTYTNKIDKQELVRLIQMKQNNVKRYAKKVLKEHGYTPILRDGFIYAEGNTPIVLLSQIGRAHV